MFVILTSFFVIKKIWLESFILSNQILTEKSPERWDMYFRKRFSLLNTYSRLKISVVWGEIFYHFNLFHHTESEFWFVFVIKLSGNVVLLYNLIKNTIPVLFVKTNKNGSFIILHDINVQVYMCFIPIVHLPNHQISKNKKYFI